MKTSLIRRILLFALISAALGLSSPVFGEDTGAVLSQALDLVHQVENDAGHSLTDSQRIDLLTQAIQTAQAAPNHRLQGHRVLAIQALRSAITEIRGGDPNRKAADDLHTADAELTTSISLAGAGQAGAVSSGQSAPPPATSTNTPPSSEDTSWMAHPSSSITPAAADVFNAARGGDLEKLKTLLAADPTLALSKVNGDMTPLLGAAAIGNKDEMELLIGDKADVNAKDIFGETALHFTAILGFKDVAEILISHGADVNARDRNGQTPLYTAMENWHKGKDVAALLLAHGADPNVADENGKAPLHLAASWIRPDQAELLLDNKANVNAKDKNGDTPLDIAISLGARDDIAQVLLAHGADVSIKGHDGLSLPEVAMQKGDQDMAGILSNPKATLGPPPAPVDGIAPQDVIARFMTDIAKNPPGPVEDDVTEAVVKTATGLALAFGTKDSARDSITTGFHFFTLDGPVTEFYAQGLATIYQGKATLTKSAAEDFQDDYDQSSASWKDKGKTVIDKGPFLDFGPGATDFTDVKVPADRHVIVSFCLVQQHGRWKVHCLYFSNAPLAGDHKDFVVHQLAAFSRKQG